MIYLFIWAFFAFAVAFIWGSARTIGFWATFLLSLILSPLVGFIIAICFPTVERKEREKKQLQLQQEQVSLLKQMQPKPIEEDLTTKLERLAQLKASGNLSLEEYNAAKEKLLFGK